MWPMATLTGDLPVSASEMKELQLLSLKENEMVAFSTLLARIQLLELAMVRLQLSDNTLRHDFLRSDQLAADNLLPEAFLSAQCRRNLNRMG